MPLDVISLALAKKSLPRNVLKGLTFNVVAGSGNLDTDPGNASNATDGTRSTYAGTYTKVMAAGGDAIIGWIDTGAEQSLLLSIYLGAWLTAAGTSVIWLEESSNNQAGSWTTIDSLSSTATSESSKNYFVRVSTKRYVRLKVTSSNANTVNLKVQEFAAVPYNPAG